MFKSVYAHEAEVILGTERRNWAVVEHYDNRVGVQITLGAISQFLDRRVNVCLRSPPRTVGQRSLRRIVLLRADVEIEV
jgi:hypothetical protein